MVTVRKAAAQDIDAVAQIYSDIHEAEESGLVTIGWDRNIYPVRQTALDSLERGDLYVEVDDENPYNGGIVGTGIINQTQVPAYAQGNWRYQVPDDQVMVLHTLIVSPKASGRGYGGRLIRFYEQYAASQHAPYLRIDTNARNTHARAMYKNLGYQEIGIVPCVFNGIEGVQLVLLEKKV